MDTHFSEGSSPGLAISLCDKVLNFGDTVLHLREEVAFANVSHQVLIDLVRVVVATKLLLDVSTYELASLPSTTQSR
jgi:hypothetical protein